MREALTIFGLTAWIAATALLTESVGWALVAFGCACFVLEWLLVD